MGAQRLRRWRDNRVPGSRQEVMLSLTLQTIVGLLQDWLGLLSAHPSPMVMAAWASWSVIRMIHGKLGFDEGGVQ